VSHPSRRNGSDSKLSSPKAPPTRPLMIGVLLVLALLLCGAWITGRSYADLHRMLGHELELRFLSGQLLSQQEKLSKSARLAAETGAPEWEARYRAAQPEFEATLRQAVAAAPNDSTIASPTWVASAALSATEAAAFEKLHQRQRAEALALLASPEYEQRQAAYVEGLNQLAAGMMSQAQARLAQQRKLVMAAALLGLALLGALGAAWVWISGLVQQYLRAVQAADAELAESNRQLESRVQARTAQLSTVNEQLREEMEQRSKMEAELRQSQKLEAIGRVAAGVAHEINTPVQFVSDNCHFLRQGIDSTLDLVGQYREALSAVSEGAMSAGDARRNLEVARKSSDADFNAENLPLAAGRALEGLDRVARIVRSMKEFSHPGDRQRMPADLKHIIESALTIAQNETKYVADVHTEFGEIPEVYCYPGELSQVMLNLLVNAAHAIDANNKGSDRRGNITVSTRLQGADAVITVQDDGCGIPAKLRDRIFEPFFTTKEVGKGTGQGLALARAMIVDRHHGRLTMESAVGRGTTFTIQIPVDARADRPVASSA
jgi:signal transduction histidine kinase